jgi:hypothetical protein
VNYYAHLTPTKTLMDVRDAARSTGIVFGAASALLGAGALFLLVVTLLDLAQGAEVPIVAVIILPAIAIASAVMGRWWAWRMRRVRSLNRILERPVVAWATLGGFRMSNLMVNRVRLFRFALMVQPPAGAPYEAEATWLLPLDLKPVLAPGMRLVVCIDPEDHAEVIVDWDRTRASWAAAPR